MAMMTDAFRLTDLEAETLERYKTNAKKHHEAARKAARKMGRKDFPMLPYECSWAFEETFRKVCRGLLPDTVLGTRVLN